MNNRSFVFYESFFETIKSLPEELQLEMYNCIVTYGLTGENIAVNPYVKAIMCMVIANIDSAKSRYMKSIEKGNEGKEYGKFGGRPKKASVEEIENLYKSGYTPQQISDELNISLSTAKRWIQTINEDKSNINEEEDSVPF